MAFRSKKKPSQFKALTFKQLGLLHKSGKVEIVERKKGKGKVI